MLFDTHILHIFQRFSAPDNTQRKLLYNLAQRLFDYSSSFIDAKNIKGLQC